MRVVVKNKKNISLVFGLIFVMASLLAVNYLKTDKAASATEFSWVSQAPQRTLSEPYTAPISANSCRYITRSVEVAGESGQANVCITHDTENIRFGTGYFGTVRLPVVSFGADSKMYKITNFNCINNNSCIYSPRYDSLITVRPLNNHLIQHLVIYENFSQRLSQSFNSAKLSVEYTADLNDPDYVFTDHNGQVIRVSAMGVSNNGQYVAIELYGSGLAQLDMETKLMKRINTHKLTYGSGYNPSPELAVSNDGRHLALTGNNVGVPKIFEITETCGDFPSESPSPPSISTPCKMSSISASIMGGSTPHTYKPKFNEFGDSLNVIANVAGANRFIQLRASGQHAPQLEYLALGDSFTSGEGETDDSYYLPDTNTEFEKCHVSTRSYPYILAQKLSIPADKVKNIACSGATTADVVGNKEFYWGQGGRLLDLSEEAAIIGSARSSALDYFIPGRLLQSSFIDLYRPNLITIGIGGNDAGFMDKLKACIMPGTCRWASSQEAKGQTAREIANMFHKLIGVYDKIKESSPSSKIYAVSYPTVINKNGSCGPLLELMLSQEEKIFMHESVIYLNAVVKAAAQKSGIGYLDIEDAYGDEILCGTKTSGSVNSLRFGDDISVIGDNFRLIGQESFHPTPHGHGMAANHIYAAYGDISLRGCTDNVNFCPNDLVTVPEPGQYWGWASLGSYPIQRNMNMANITKSHSGYSVNIETPDSIMMPGTLVEVDIYSELVSLGNLEVNSDGSVTGEFSMPDSISAGYHTLLIKGTSPSGESVELYDLVAYVEEYDDKGIQSSNSTDDEDSDIEYIDNPWEISSSTDDDLHVAHSEDTLETYSLISRGEELSLQSGQGLSGESKTIKNSGVLSSSSSGADKSFTSSSRKEGPAYYRGFLIISSLVLVLGAVWFIKYKRNRAK